MDPPDVQGIEQKKGCQLEILVNAYFTVVNGIKMYNKGRNVSLFVDSEEYALTDLEKDIGPYFQWGSYQKANFWVIEGDVMKCRLDSDAQLIELIRSTEVLKLMMIVARLEEMEEPAVLKQVRAANVQRKEVPVVAEVMEQDVVLKEVAAVAEVMEQDVVLKEVPAVAEVMEQDAPNAAVVDIGPELRELPEFGETIAGPPRAEEEEKEHFMTVGCDPDGDDPAGADEEWRYFQKVDDNKVQPIKNVEVEVQNRKRSRPMPYFDTEAVPDDEAGLVDDFVVAHTTYDKENPVIKVGHTFVDKAEFMETIRKTKTESVESSNIVAEPSNFVVDPKVMSSPGVTTRRMASLSPASPGVTTRRMASLSPASPGVTTRRMASLSPASPGVTTRRMASISPGGINRRLIIE